MSARKRGTPSSFKSSKRPSINTRKTSEKSPSVTVLDASVADYSHSQRYMQHKLDMAYNQYIRNLAMEQILTEKHDENLRLYDEALTHYQEMHEASKEELNCKEDYLSNLTTTMDNDNKLKFLENALREVNSSMNKGQIVIKLDKINTNLQLICDNLNFENITFVGTEENYNRVQNILKEMKELLQEINEGNNKDFNTAIDNISQIKDLLTKIQKNQEKAKCCQNKLNKLVLKTASLSLSKKNDDGDSENFGNITPI